MNKLEKLQHEINDLREEFVPVRARLEALLAKGELDVMKAYAYGALDMAQVFTGNEYVIYPLRRIVEILK